MGVTVTVECDEHGRMPYQADRMAWRCGTCDRVLTPEAVYWLTRSAKDGDTVPIIAT